MGGKRDGEFLRVTMRMNAQPLHVKYDAEGSPMDGGLMAVEWTSIILHVNLTRRPSVL